MKPGLFVEKTGQVVTIKKNWVGRTNMRMIRTRTKIEAIVAVSILIMVSIGSVFAVTRTITSSGDSFDTFIRNSKGNYWTMGFTGLQAAIYDLNTTGGEVRIPKGTITTTSAIQITHNNITLIGTGNASIIKRGAALSSYALNVENAKNIIIEKLNVDGNAVNNAGRYYGPIEIHGTSSHVTIRDCTLHDSNCSVIRCDDAPTYVTVEDCYIYGVPNIVGNWPAGIWFAGDYCIARNNIIKDTYGNGIVFEDTPGPVRYCIADGNIISGRISVGINMEFSKSSDCEIINNQIYNLNSTAYFADLHTYGNGIFVSGENNTVSNNVIRNMWGYGISIENVRGSTTVSGNVIYNLSCATYGYGIGCDTTGGARNDNVTVTGNILRNIKSLWGIRYCRIVTDNIVEGVSAATAYLGILGGDVISNNRISYFTLGIQPSARARVIGNYISNVPSAGTGGIYCPSSTGNVSIIGNYVSTSGMDGIILSSCNNCQVIGNTVTGAITTRYAISSTGTANYNVFSGNIMYGNSHNMIIVGANNVNVSGHNILH